MIINYKLLTDLAFEPSVKHRGDAGIDFYSLEDYVIKPQKLQICRTGITIEIPNGYVGQIWPKSRSNFLIGGGIIDYGYQGEIFFKIFNLLDYDLVIRSGDPLGQVVIVKNVDPELSEQWGGGIHVERTERGESGGIVDQVATITGNVDIVEVKYEDRV